MLGRGRFTNKITLQPPAPARAFQRPPIAGRHADSLPARAGFTILELLVYAVASGLLLASLVVSFISNIRSNTRLEFYQRLEARWSQLSQLIQTETTEAQSVLYGQAVGCGTTATSLLTLSIPYVRTDTTTGLQSTSVSMIHYYEVGSGSDVELRRCGPPYLINGSLHHPASSSASTLAPMTDLIITSANPDGFAFRMNLYTPTDQLGLTREGSASVGVEPIDPG